MTASFQLKVGGWAHKTSVNPPFILLKCLYQDRKVSGHVFVRGIDVGHVFVRGIDVASFYDFDI
jgi:hypothetical protein